MTDIRKQASIWLDLERVEQKPGPYTMSFAFSLEPLAESIRKIGLINPPRVAANQEGQWQIVSGYRRIHALKSIGEFKVLCEDVTSVLPSPLERLLANFYENAVTRKFNDIEKAMILQRLQNYLPRKEILATFLPILSLPRHDGTLEIYLKLADLEEEIQRAVAGEKISMRTLKVLLEFDDASRLVLYQSLTKLRFNFNQQIKFIDYVHDISIRDGRAIPEILSEASFATILENPQWNNPQKTKAVFALLRSRRNPRLTWAQRAIESKISSVSLPSAAAIHYDPYLEAPNYRLEICFKNGKDLKKSIAQLHSLDALETIPDLWQAHESQD